MADNFLSIKMPKLSVMDAEEFKRAFDLEKTILAEAQSALTRIKADTTAGRQAEGGAFRPYSSGYRKLRQAAGLSTTPNLTVTQELLRSMAVEPIREDNKIGARIVFQFNHAPAKPLLPKKNRKSRNGQAGQAGAAGKQKSAKPTKSQEVKPQEQKAPKPKKKKEIIPYKGYEGTDGMPNAELAQKLYKMGFVGWFTFAQKDLVRIQRNVNRAINRVVKQLFTTK